MAGTSTKSPLGAAAGAGGDAACLEPVGGMVLASSERSDGGEGEQPCRHQHTIYSNTSIVTDYSTGTSSCLQQVVHEVTIDIAGLNLSAVAEASNSNVLCFMFSKLLEFTS